MWIGNSLSYWFTAQDLGLDNDLIEEWNQYILYLNKAGIRLSSSWDKLVWYFNNESETIFAKAAYSTIVHAQVIPVQKWWFFGL